MDEERIRRAAKGDHAAFAELVQAYQKPVYNLALRMAGDPEDALDLSQEAFLRAWRGIKDYRFDAAFSTWLYRLTGNVCIDFLRRRKKERTVPLTFPSEDGEEQALELPDPGPDTEARMLERLDREAVATALSRLEPEHRMALTLRVVDGLRYAEIAAALGVPEGTVKSRIARARQRMRAMLQDHGNKNASPSSKRGKGGLG